MSLIIFDFLYEGLNLVLLLSGLPLAAALVVGLGFGILQAATQIQEQTLSFVPKIFVVYFISAFLFTFAYTQLTEFAVAVWSEVLRLQT